MNIGIDLVPGSGRPRTIILDLGCCERILEGAQRSATPGAGGTIWYLAPEQEMGPHGLSVDVWSLGVIGIELLGYPHPCAFGKNPWRHGACFEDLRPKWSQKYEKMITTLKAESVGPWARRNRLCKIVLTMLRHQYAREAGMARKRSTAQELLKDSLWSMTDDEPPTKKR